MCYNCGCSNPHDTMGHPDNITVETLQHLAEHNKKTLDETKMMVLKAIQEDKVTDPHLIEMFEKAAAAWGQSVDEAKRNTANLLKRELNIP